jgi:hypothetical protein
MEMYLTQFFNELRSDLTTVVLLDDVAAWDDINKKYVDILSLMRTPGYSKTMVRATTQSTSIALDFMIILCHGMGGGVIEAPSNPAKRAVENLLIWSCGEMKDSHGTTRQSSFDESVTLAKRMWTTKLCAFFCLTGQFNSRF